jgi:hypothetical protein
MSRTGPRGVRIAGGVVITLATIGAACVLDTTGLTSGATPDAGQIGFCQQEPGASLTLARDEDASTSPPASFLARIDKAASGGSTANYLTRVIASPAASFHLECDVRIDDIETAQGALLYAVSLGLRPGTTWTHFVGIGFERPNPNATSFYVEEAVPQADGSRTYPLTPFSCCSPALGAFAHFDLDVTFDAEISKTSVIVKVDGTEAYHRPLVDTGRYGDSELDLGIVFGSGVTAVHYDNVLINVK